MSTETIRPSVDASSARVIAFSPVAILRFLGSLKITVLLFALSLVLVLVGTLAQDKMNMLDVKQDYFLAWIAKVPIDHLFPQAFYAHETPLRGWFPFPGGALIGCALMINLVAAKATRFHVQAKGQRLLAGLGFVGLGLFVTALTVSSGSNAEGLQGAPPISFASLWLVLIGLLAVISGALLYGASRTRHALLRWSGWTAGVAGLLFVVFSVFTGYRIGDPGMRIVWQLMTGLNAAVILMIGCWLLFRKQGGNVLLHIGVAILMLGQFSFGDRQTEQRLNLVEGQASNTFVNLDKIELQFAQESDDRRDIVAIPSPLLQAAAESGDRISDPRLPVDVKVVEFFENAGLVEADGSSPATVGLGLQLEAKRKEKSGGTDSRIDFAAAYVELLEKGSDESLGVHLVHQFVNDGEVLLTGRADPDRLEEVTVDEERFELGLRLRREVKPYWVKLDDVRRINWSGTSTPRDYSSFIRIIDPESGEDEKKRVWMNNPLRYRGETFYQSNYDALPSGKETTGLQIVANAGWLIPYMACSITGLGMTVHFWGTLMTFLGRRRRELCRASVSGEPVSGESVSGESVSGESVTGESVSTQLKPELSQSPSRWPWVTAALIGMIVFLMLIPRQAVTNVVRPRERAQTFDFYEAGKIPVQSGGRVMPLDSFARQTLKAMSNKESLPLDREDEKIRELRDRVDGRRISAIQWLFEVASSQSSDSVLRDLPMFRIDAQDVLSELEIDRRAGHLYSLNEIAAQLGRFSQVLNEVRTKDRRDRSFRERKFVELDMRTRSFTTASVSLKQPTLEIMSEEQFKTQFMSVFPPEQFEAMFPDGKTESVRRSLAVRELETRLGDLRSMDAPSVIPPPEDRASSADTQPKWTPFSLAYFQKIMRGEGTGANDESLAGVFGTLVDAYRDSDQIAFNSAVDKFRRDVQDYPVQGYSPARVWVERWLDGQSPTSFAFMIYLLCFLLGLVGFAVNNERFRQFNWSLLLIAFVVHTLVVIGRVYVTGRAPVINLYSSAIFVGWVAVLFALVIELLFRFGAATVVAAVVGAMTIRVGYYLTLTIGSADTMPVLQAVLDTQFWLTTHVLSVSMGYVATIFAGFVGMTYLVARWVDAGDAFQRDIYRVMYSATCFGILFSFIGTVLGGLWADDSWGRFWGWDPKENGALLIVIWNALILHARWDRMIQGRGFAVLAIFGNVVTSWSWFGTNELGIGLHSYGFTEGTLLMLSAFFLFNMVFMVAGLVIPRGLFALARFSRPAEG